MILLVGALAGFLAGLFGVGGGLLIVPGLVVAAHMSQRLAHGTSLAAVAPISVASAATYAAHGNIEWAAVAWLAVGGVAGAVAGTHLLHVLPQRTLALLFAAVLLVSAVRLFLATDAASRPPLSAAGAVGLIGIGLAAGALAGLLGVGGGVVIVPALVVLFGIPPVVAKGTSAAVIVPTAVIGTWRNRRLGNADLRAAAIVGGAGVVTAALGGIVAEHLGDDASNVLFALLLLVVAIRLLVTLPARGEPAARPDSSV